MKDNSTVSILEVRRLLMELRDRAPHVHIRFRLIGEMWQNFFLQVITVTDTVAILMNPGTKQVSFIEFNKIMQFELESRYQFYHPFNHYHVVPKQLTSLE